MLRRFLLRRPFLLAAVFLGGAALAAPKDAIVPAVDEPASDDVVLALAQDTGGAPGGTGARPEIAPAVAQEEEGDDDDPASGVPPARYLNIAGESVASMRASLTKGLEELKVAREKKDAVELTCVNEQVTAMKGILRVSEDAFVSLQEAQSANDTERSRYEFRKIQVSKRKMDDLLQAAINCAGAEATSSNTSVEMEVDPSLAIIDPYYGDPSFFFDPATTLVGNETGTIGNEDPQTPIPPASGT